MQVCNVGALALGWLAASWLPLTAVAAPQPADRADSIYRGGDIVPVDDQLPTAQAVVVRDGIIVAVIEAIGGDAMAFSWDNPKGWQETDERSSAQAASASGSPRSTPAVRLANSGWTGWFPACFASKYFA
jgi:hypothetical protein